MKPHEQYAAQLWASFRPGGADTWTSIAVNLGAMAALAALDGNTEAALFYAACGTQARARSKAQWWNLDIKAKRNADTRRAWRKRRRQAGT